MTTAALPTRKLGKNGPSVTAIGFGTMGLSAFYGPPKPDAERFAVLDAAFAAGELNWDSADIYRDSEDLLGQWFAANPGKRDSIFLATKFGGGRLSEDGQIGAPNSSPEYCKKAIERSLKRLGLPYVDLYYAHRLDGVTPVEKTVEAMAQLKAEGKIKYLGLSEVSAESLRRAHKVHPISAVQVEYSPFSLDIESPQIALLQACRELGVAVVAYSPIGRGILGGKLRSPDDFAVDDFRRYAPRFSAENFGKNLVLVDKIVEIANKKGVTPSQLTLAWLLSQGDDIIPIPGTTVISRLHENLGALKIELTEEEKKVVREASEAAEVHGQRYPEAYSSSLFADTPAL